MCLPTFGVTVHGFWTDHHAGAHRLIALLSFREGGMPPIGLLLAAVHQRLR